MNTTAMYWLIVAFLLLSALGVTLYQLYPDTFPWPGGDVRHDVPLYEKTVG